MWEEGSAAIKLQHRHQQLITPSVPLKHLSLAHGEKRQLRNN